MERLTELSNSIRNDKILITSQITTTIKDLARVARLNSSVEITKEKSVIDKIHESQQYIQQQAQSGKYIYGVTSAFGGRSDQVIPIEQIYALQNNLIKYLQTGAGGKLRRDEVRAGMFLRIKSLIFGISGIRLELLQRLELFLNEQITPVVFELGSIGASGDLVPLSHITAAVIGHDKCIVENKQGNMVPIEEVFSQLKIEKITLIAKEGLAMINGTAVMAGVAALCVHDASAVVAMSLQLHALYIQALMGSDEPFKPFIHMYKPHKGQIYSAKEMNHLLMSSKFTNLNKKKGQLIQDRYSLRCLPQFYGPIVEGLVQITSQIQIEMNSVTDNPLMDIANNKSYHGGNFLGQYVGTSMDNLRYYLGLVSKHLDVQISQLMQPAFSNGLPPSLIGNTNNEVNMGLNGLQISGNSMMPLISFYGNSIADRFPTHAEMHNQNINSQGYNSAILARKQMEVLQQYLAVGLIFAIQAIELRSKLLYDEFNASPYLSPATLPLYLAFHQLLNKQPNKKQPFIYNDDEQNLSEIIKKISEDLKNESGCIREALRRTIDSLEQI